MNAAIERARRQLCDATDGRVKIKEVNVTFGNASEEWGDVGLISDSGCPHSSVLGGHATLFPGADGNYDSGTIAHELGHLLRGLASDRAFNAEQR